MYFKVLALTTLLTSALAAPSVLPRATAFWTIRNFTRVCSTDATSCAYNLSIDQGDGIVTACTIVNTGNPATTASWYGVPCNQTSDWELSWGWDYQNDFTVLTAVNEPTQTEAFFGYNHPNSATSYPDNGPNAVQSTGVA